MKKYKTKFGFTLILLAQILICCLKIEQDIFAYPEYDSQPQKTYTEQLYSKTELCFKNTASIVSPSVESSYAGKNNIGSIPQWHSVFLLYNSHVHILLKRQIKDVIPVMNIISVLHRKNITHQSSDDEYLS